MIRRIYPSQPFTNRKHLAGVLVMIWMATSSVAVLAESSVPVFELETILESPHCTSVDMAPDGAKLYARTWLHDESEGYRAFDAASLDFIRDYDLGQWATPWSGRVSADGLYLWTTRYYSGTVAKVNLATGGQDLQISVGSWPYSLVADQMRRYLYVGQGSPGTGANGSIKKLDTQTETVIGSAPLTGEPSLILPLTAEGDYLYVPTRRPSILHKIRTADMSVVLTTPLPASITGDVNSSLSPSGEHIYIPDAASNLIRVYETSAFAEVISYSMTAPRGFFVSPSGAYAVVMAGTDDLSLHIFDMAQGVISQTLPLPAQEPLAHINSPAWDSQAGRIFIPFSTLTGSNGGVAVIAEQSQGLVAWWAMEDRQGDQIPDRSGNGHTLTIWGSPTFDGPVVSFDYDGVLFAEDADELDLLGDWTMSAWARTDTNLLMILTKVKGWYDHEGGYYLNTGIGSTRVGIYKENLNNWDFAVPPSPANHWHHIAATFTKTSPQSGIMRIYVNGELKLEDAGPYVMKANPYPLVIGGGYGPDETFEPQWSKGDLGDVRIYNRALSLAEIADELYQNHGPGPDSDGDGWADVVDNCPDVYNPDQLDTSGNGIGDACDAPSLVSAVSRKWHEGAGAFDISLTLDKDNLMTECRVGAALRIVLAFTRNVLPADGILDNEVALSSGLDLALSLDGPELTIEAWGATSPSCLTLTLNGLVDEDGQPLTGPMQLYLAILSGDVNGDGRVNVFDLVNARNALNQPVTATNFRTDVNATGNINIFDLVAIRNNLNKQVDCSAPPGMVLIPAGEFHMGDTFNEGLEEERPVHAVWLDAFYMDQYEVTNQQYADALNWAWSRGGHIAVTDGIVYKAAGETSLAYCATTTNSSHSRITWNGSTFGLVPGMEHYPMARVTWYGAAAYCNWRSMMEGRTPCYDLTTWECDFNANGYRLPTEAEWEKAARGGVEGRRFPWSDSDEIQHARANYISSTEHTYDTSLTLGYHPTFNTGNIPYTSPVGYFAPNGYGLYDMAGNLWEWCNDWHASNYYLNSPPSNPRGPASGQWRVFRGGSWLVNAFSCRAAHRSRDWPWAHYNYVGFRCAARAE